LSHVFQHPFDLDTLKSTSHCDIVHNSEEGLGLNGYHTFNANGLQSIIDEFAKLIDMVGMDDTFTSDCG
jgi:hypothetical protein